MKKSIVIALVAGFIGFIAGNLFWYLASPLWIDDVVAESAAAVADSELVAIGQFSDADAAHKGAGNVSLFQNNDGSHAIRFTEFEVTNGPDLEVWMVQGDGIQSSQDVKNRQWVSLGRLKGNIGDQNYDVPDGIDWSCLLYTSPSPRDQRGSRMPSSA